MQAGDKQHACSMTRRQRTSCCPMHLHPLAVPSGGAGMSSRTSTCGLAPTQLTGNSTGTGLSLILQTTMSCAGPAALGNAHSVSSCVSPIFRSSPCSQDNNVEQGSTSTIHMKCAHTVSYCVSHCVSGSAASDAIMRGTATAVFVLQARAKPVPGLSRLHMQRLQRTCALRCMCSAAGLGCLSQPELTCNQVQPLQCPDTPNLFQLPCCLSDDF